MTRVRPQNVLIHHFRLTTGAKTGWVLAPVSGPAPDNSPRRRFMQRVQGTVSKDGSALADNLQITLETETTRSGNENWSGFFVLPAGAELGLNDDIDLSLTDGRSKKVQVNRKNVIAGGSTSISFQTPL
jgi:hypothetical protein